MLPDRAGTAPVRVTADCSSDDFEFLFLQVLLIGSSIR